MSGPAKTIFCFGIYLVIVGLGLVVFPKLPLLIFGLKVEGLAWIRILGFLVLIFSYCHINLARAEVRDFFRWTVHTRGLVPLFFAVLIAAGLIEPVLMVFAAGDFIGALATGLALCCTREDRARQPA